MTLPCIVCDKELEPAIPEPHGRAENQPYAATSFWTAGHYGSTVFDPMDGTRLEINVCDGCLTKKNDKVLFLGRDGAYERWKP